MDVRRSESSRDAGDAGRVETDLRRSPRMGWSTPSRLIVLSAGPAGSSRERISTVGHDLSAHGVACLSPVSIEHGVRCEVSLPLADSGLFAARGRVVRCVHEQAALYLIAVEFDQPLPADVITRF